MKVARSRGAFLTRLLLRGSQVHVWQRQASQFDPQRMDNTLGVKWFAFLASQGLTTVRQELREKSGLEVRARDQ